MSNGNISVVVLIICITLYHVVKIVLQYKKDTRIRNKEQS